MSGLIASSLPILPRAYAAFHRTQTSSVERALISGSTAFSLPILPSASATLPRTSLFLAFKSFINESMMLSGLMRARTPIAFSLSGANSAVW